MERNGIRRRMTALCACLALLVCLAAAAAQAEQAFTIDPERVERVLADAYMSERYGKTWESMPIVNTSQKRQHTGTLYYPPGPKEQGHTSVSAFVEYDRGDLYNGMTDKESLEGKLNDILNDLHTVEKSGGAARIDFDGLYSGKVVMTYRNDARLSPWTLGEHSFAPQAYVIRPFFFRDAPDTIKEERIYLYVYIVTEDRDIAWLCADDEIIRSVAATQSDDPDVLWKWLGIEPPESDGTVENNVAKDATAKATAEAAVADATATDAAVAETPVPPGDATADETAPTAEKPAAIGYVTIRKNTTAILREGGGQNYPSVERAKAGTIFRCIGVSESGWYELILEDGRTAFVSPKPVEFTPLP